MVGSISRRNAIAMGGLAFVLGITQLYGCSSSSPSPDKTDDAPSQEHTRLVMGISVDPDGLDPHRTAAASTFEVTANIYETLVGVTVSGELVPGLAESWDVSDDGLTITFNLREGVSFSNGNPCDAQACAASFAHLVDALSPHSGDYERYTFEADGPTRLVVSMDELNVAALTDFAYAWSAVVDASVADGLSSQPVGTGPYVLVSWDPQQSLKLARNEKYWGDAPAIGEVELRVLPDPTSQSSSLRAGEIDLLWATSEQADSFASDDRFTLIQGPQNGVQLMAMNCANKALSDVRVRQAINHAVDKDSLIQTVWWGYGEKIGSHFPVVLSGYVDTNDVYPYDPAESKRLLKEAGYGDGLTLKMRLPKDYQMYVDAGQVIADSLEKVGITCDIEIVEWATWLDEVYNGRKYDLTVVGHTGRLDPIALLDRYASTRSDNYFNYASDEVDALIESYHTELDAQERTRIVGDIQKRLSEDVPALYIQDPVTTYIAAKWVQGFAMYPIDIYTFKDVVVAE